MRALPKTADATAVRLKHCGTGDNRRDAETVISNWYGVTMEEFSGRMLSSFVDRPVIDKTGLTGRYDISLKFAREKSGGPVSVNGVYGMEPSVNAADVASAPLIFEEIRKQLRLKLSVDKGLLTVIVVDRAEKPSGNGSG